MTKKSIDKSKLISELTIEEFLSISKDILKKKDEFVYGYDGLASLLGCSRSKAGELIQSKRLESCTYKSKGIIFFDKEKVLEILRLEKK